MCEGKWKSADVFGKTERVGENFVCLFVCLFVGMKPKNLRSDLKYGNTGFSPFLPLRLEFLLKTDRVALFY